MNRSKTCFRMLWGTLKNRSSKLVLIYWSDFFSNYERHFVCLKFFFKQITKT